MRKQAKILLFALLVVLMVATMVVVASAAKTTEGAEDAYYLVEAEAGNEYYSTIAEAIEAVKDGGKVTLLKDVAEEAPSLGVEKTYTIDGAGFTMTLTPAAREYRPESEEVKPQAGVAFHIWLGHVTLKNVTLELAADTKATVMFFIQNQHRNPEKLSFTLEDVKAEFSSQYGIWLHQEANLTIKGADTKIKGGTSDFIRLQSGAGGSVITVEDGTFDIPVCGIRPRGNKFTVNLKGGTFNITKNFIYIGDASNNCNFNISGGTYTTATTTASQFFYYMYNGTGNTLTISGGTFTHQGTNAYTFARIAAKNNTITFPEGGTAVINAGVAKYIFMANAGSSNADGSVFNIQSGTFTDSMCWFFVKQAVTVNIGGTAHFSEPNKTLDAATAINSTRYVGGISVNASAIVNVTGGTIETNKENAKPCAIYADGSNIVNISGDAVIKGTNNALRIGGSVTVNVSGGAITNIGAANQLIRVNYKGTSTINILPGANLVQNQNQYVVRVQAGSGIINMTGGTVVANGTSAPFYFSVTDDAVSELNITGGTVVAKNSIALVSYAKSVVIKNATLVVTSTDFGVDDEGESLQKTELFKIGSKTNATYEMSDVVVLYNATEDFALTPDMIVPASDFSAKIKFAGELYNLYMDRASNAEEDIVTEETFGASFYLGEDESQTGLRFTSYLSDSIIALAKAALDAGKTVSYGTLIAPADYVAAAGAFTKEALEKVNAPAGKMKYADVPANVSKRDANGDGVAEAFSATLVGIQEVNYDRVFASVAYVVIDGETFYSAYNSADNARCLQAIVVEYVESDEFLALMEEELISEAMLELITKYLGEYA